MYIFPQGGIGNQLFQLCAGLSIQKELGGKVFMLPIQSNKHSGRDYRIDPLLYTRIIPIDTIDHIKMYTQNSPFEEWTPKTFEKLTEIGIEGYFQYLPAIREVVDEVRDDLLLFLRPKIELMKAKYSLSSDTVFIHIRRGDYVEFKEAFGGVGEKYYTESTKIFEPCRFLVISNDPEWCKDQPWLSEFFIVDEKDELDSLALMACCSGAIIANSTFSWWGAQLSKAKKVCFPSKWFYESKPNLFPENWTRVEVCEFTDIVILKLLLIFLIISVECEIKEVQKHTINYKKISRIDFNSDLPILLICSCQKYARDLDLALTRVSSKKWITIGILGQNITETFVYEKEGNYILNLNVKDAYENLPHKIFLAMQWCAQHFPKCPGVFKTDDDIQVECLKKFAGSLEKNKFLNYWGFQKESLTEYSKMTAERIALRFEDKTIRTIINPKSEYLWGAGYWV